MNEELKQYIQTQLFPEYAKNEEGHRIEHINYVIERSLKFASQVPDINMDMVYTIAAYHDIGHHIDAKNHEKVSAEMLLQDKELKKILDSYTLCLNEGKACSEEIFKEVKILKDEEKHVILCFFSELGKLDVYNQTKQIENSKIKFQEIVNSCTEEKKKYGTLYLKLGIILGLLIALILF